MPSRYRHTLPFGAEILPDGTVRFRLWAPAQPAVTVVVARGDRAIELAMVPDGAGWFELTTDRAAADSRYCYRRADVFAVPDPASPYLPNDGHGPTHVAHPYLFLSPHPA